MKAKLFAIGLLLFALAACIHLDDRSVETRLIASPENKALQELSAIDSLMWYQPDSALMCLLPYFDTCCRDALNASPDNVLNASPDNTTDTTRRNHCVSTTAYNRHYAHLLLSELLYKNDYPQTNRMELLQAVAYFDSIAQVPESAVAEHSRSIEGSSKEQIIFLNARTHYINGVGYYENDSLVPACAEYLKTLEIMENHFEEKELIGHKARFMAYTYNRLGDMFSEQLLAEPAIACYKQALFYCKREPTSIYGIPVLLYNLGIQHDIARQKDSAAFYYDRALANMPDFDNIHYRDILTTQAMFAYHSGSCLDSVAKNLKYVMSLTQDDDERLTRFLTIGNLLFEDKQYDSSRFYLDTVFEQQGDIQSKILAAEKLCSIYQMVGDSLKTQKYVSFLAGFTMQEIDKKTDVSKINEMYKDYLTQKQEKRAEEEREKAIKRVIRIIIPIAFLVALVIFVLAKLRGKKQLRDKEKHHQREMESERQAHKIQQAALSSRLKRSNEELRDVSNQLEQMLAKNVSSEAVLSDDYKAFVNTPICLYIVDLVHTQQFKSKMDYLIYKDNALSKEQLLALRDAAETNLPRFVSQIRKQFPKLTDNDMDYCYLFLLGLNEADISALMQRAYTTVCDRSRKINRIIGANESLYHTLRNMLSE